MNWLSLSLEGRLLYALAQGFEFARTIGMPKEESGMETFNCT